MTLLGLSILVASISFLCYKNPPSSWSFLEWLRRPKIQDIAKGNLDAPESATSHDRQSESSKKIPRIKQDEVPVVEKAEQDRKTMPPPPPPFKKPSSKLPSPPTTLHASANIKPPTILSNPIDGQEDDDEELTVPSFPAANSAQRASGGARTPRLNSFQQTGLMAPPPPRAPLPNRGPPTSSNSSSSLSPPPTHNAIPTKPRKKVLLTPGHSPLDWARLTSSNANLRGLPLSKPYIRVPPSLLKKYTGRKGKDAWTVLGGKVYNITPYLPYHPGGGPELMKAAGRDGTRLFGEVHPWVNWEGMLEGCLVGIAVEEGDVKEENMEEMD